MDIHRENITFSFTSIPTAEHINTMEMTYLWVTGGSLIPASNCNQSLEVGIPFLQFIKTPKSTCNKNGLVLKSYH
jgi:hypothetical protein